MDGATVKEGSSALRQCATEGVSAEASDHLAVNFARAKGRSPRGAPGKGRDRDQEKQGSRVKAPARAAIEVNPRRMPDRRTAPYASSAPPRERKHAINPNSPFAKLAALADFTGRKE